MNIARHWLRPTAAATAAAIAALGVTIGAAAAENATKWDGDDRAAARLIAGEPSTGNAAKNAVVGDTDGDAAFLRAGLELRLKPGWKTYWRYPGDSGIPPHFNFTGSDNVKSVDVLWPAPARFVDAGGSSVGYEGHVILPLHVTPTDPRQPVRLRLDLNYGVCEKLCVPAFAQLELPLTGSGSDPALSSTLAAAEARVPKKAKVGDGDGLAIRAVHEQTDGRRRRLVVDVAAPTGAKVDLIAEGPTPDWALPLPELVAGAPAGLQRFAFEIDGLPSGASAKGAAIRLTAVAGGQAIEVTTRLD
jgi:DsbC/DsbD-like thiol-disulfide interchange protein